MNLLEFPFPRITYKDILEIFIIAFFIYQLLLLIRGTRAIQILQGVGVLLVSLWICNLFVMRTLYWMLDKVIVMIFVAIPIVFQPELRRALGQIGKGGMIGLLTSREEEISCMVDEIVDACFHMSRKKIGAIVVIERDIGLEEFMETGTQLNAAISSRLLQTIFFHNSPLHDGAVIIKENRIYSAACYLPLTENADIDKDLGTRHRAAIGITEHTDSIAIVVSEETGSVSVCTNGRLKYNMSMKALSHHLRALCNPKKRIEKRFFFFPVIKKFAPETETIKDLKAKIARTSLLKGKFTPGKDAKDMKIYEESAPASVIDEIDNTDVIEEFVESEYMESDENDFSEEFITMPLPHMEELQEEAEPEETDNLVSNEEYQKNLDISGEILNIKQD